jgi:hypothetical protein
MLLAARVELTTQTRLLAGVVAIAFLVGVFELVRRHRLQERYSVIWVLGGFALLGCAIFPDMLELMARALGFQDTNAALFTVVLGLALSLCFHFTVVLSRQSEQITRLAQDSAIERAELQMLRDEHDLAQPGDGETPGVSSRPAGRQPPAAR